MLFMRNTIVIFFILLLSGCTSTGITQPDSLVDPTSTNESANSDILYFEDFSDAQSSWWIGEDDEGKSYISNEQYHFLNYKGDMGNCVYAGGAFSDGVINADIRQISGGSDSEAGILFRDNRDSNGYLFLIKNDGYFHVEKYVNNTPSSLLRMVNSTSILTGTRTNNITISMNNNILDFYVNNTFVGSVNDSSFTSGDIGLCIFPSSSSDAEYAFDNITVVNYNPLSSTTPKRPEETPTPSYHSITWKELADFIARDHTNWKPYDIDNYVCLDYAIDLVENARMENINAWIVGVDFTNGEIGHAFVAFETSDKGIRYVEPQTDYTYSDLTIGHQLCDDWGQDECWGTVASITYFSDCDHDQYCTELEP